jgi:prepilin-type N-terminal cleavage/methylation domain-containing protein
VSAPRRGKRGSAAGFTLIEVLAAVFLTAVVMSVAIAMFVNLSDSTDAAAAKARQGRLALAVIDRIARDLEGAYLLATPAGVDPLNHPWVFMAESHEGGSGSDRVRFITRNHRPRNPYDHGSDLAVVTYMLHESENGRGFDLLRAVQPGLAVDGTSEFPSADDELFMVMAENVEHLALRFMSEDFEWHEDWHSGQLEQSGTLPRAAEIELAYLAELPEGAEDASDLGDFGEDLDEAERPSYTGRVILAMQPIDLAAMLTAVEQDGADADTGDDQDGDGDEGDDDFDEDLDDLDKLDLDEVDPDELEKAIREELGR